MLGFAANAYHDPAELPTVCISEVTAFVLLAMAIIMCAFGLISFLWRT